MKPEFGKQNCGWVPIEDQTSTKQVAEVFLRASKIT